MTLNEIRVRIAPSPSGNLHVGTARTALFNYLFARHNSGKFILRIEDTDAERSDEKYVKNIFDSLKAMGLDWDEGPDVGGDYGSYRQSERLELYKSYAEKLLQSGHAYNFESAIKFKMPSKQLVFNDLIKGKLEFDTSLMEDFVIIKSNGMPTYNFAVVVDDIEMKISHIIRGEDHISNTPRQIAVYEALCAEIPQFAHVGMILAPDRTKLSKRHGATAVSEFIEEGYLPEAFVNFLALLGWTAPERETAEYPEIMTKDELIRLFSLERVSSSNAIFEFDKLNWMNGIYIRHLPVSKLIKRLMPYLQGYDLSIYSDEQLEVMINAVKEPLVKLSEVTDAVSYFFGDSINISDETRESALSAEETGRILEEFANFAENIDYGDVEKIHDQLGEFRTRMKPLKPKQVMWAIRAALTGRTHGADMGVVISLLGRERVLLRIKETINL